MSISVVQSKLFSVALMGVQTNLSLVFQQKSAEYSRGSWYNKTSTVSVSRWMVQYNAVC